MAPTVLFLMCTTLGVLYSSAALATDVLVRIALLLNFSQVVGITRGITGILTFLGRRIKGSTTLEFAIT